MANEHNNRRINKFEKRRRNNKFIKYGLLIASLLVVSLIGIWIFGGDSDENMEQTAPEETEADSFFHDVRDESEERESESTENNKSEIKNNEINRIEEKDDKDEQENEDKEIETETVESDDPNVIEAVVGNWNPIGTEQTGPHEVTNFENGSQDRIEIKRAVSMVTGLPEESIIEHWIGNGGSPDKVIATVSDQSLMETYRVYLDWVDEEGWQPTRMETLKENDIN